MVIVLKDVDKQELALQFPALNCSLLRGAIWGTLDFACSYDGKTKEIAYNDLLDNYIPDSYEIRIDFNQKDSFGFPKVFEDSAIIENFALSNSIHFEDLHINKCDEKSCCLGIFPEYEWKGATSFIKDKIIPFFYWQSFRRIYGHEPWKGHSHGNTGLLEAMQLQPKESSKGCNRNKPCPCGSGRKYKKCCIKWDTVLKSKLVKR